MKRILLGMLFVCAAPAQLPRIGDINFYGLRKLTAEQVLTAARVGPGERIPGSRTELEDRIADLPDVVAAHVQTVCCEGDRATLFIGIEERGEPEIALRLPPTGSSAPLPADVMARYREYEGELLRAAVNGTAPEADPTVKRAEERFQAFAAGRSLILRTKLRTGSDAEQRAAAATVVRYVSNKGVVVEDLLFALRDPDETVRTNAARSLAALAVMAREHPALDIRISPARLVDMLNSVVLSDRMESTKALLVLTEAQNVAALDLIRKQALPSLAEMARWKTAAYALPPFRLLGRTVGLTDEQVAEAWQKGEREQLIQKALALQ